ncbi:MAG: FAD:protein FMN transferase, partial [Armatimonadetes bacterium]|nr:FAD:protein FMN transferase [Armatimonadota bacterium]
MYARTRIARPAAVHPLRARRYRFLPWVECLLVLPLMVPSSPAEPPARFTYTQYHMGVDARLVVYAPDRSAAERACAAAFARLAALDTIMSDYRRDSELNRLCAQAGGAPVRISPDLFRVFQRAQEVSERSRGAFDITAGPLIRLWRTARKLARLPDAAELDQARRRVGWKNLKLDARRRTAQLLIPGMQLDLGGIAKGDAADAAQQVLRKHGITRALVELGGDIVVSDP